MSIALTDEQMREAERSLLRITDPRTGCEYVLVRAELYEHLQRALGEDFDLSAVYPAIDAAFAENWNCPKLDDYDRYEEFKK
jgi:hypothetical protein